MNKVSKRIGKTILAISLFLAVLTLALFAADYLRDSPGAQEFIAKFSYGGVIVVAIIAGLNVLVPLPAATFVPIFTEAGLWFPGIIIALTIGTVIADYLGFAFGKWGRESVSEKYPRTMERFDKLYTRHRTWIPFLIFIYAAVMPFPNEAMILPLAVLGAPFRSMIIPLILGNIIHQMLFAYGVQNIFTLLF